MTIARELGERLRAYRTQRGWSQEEMAERADLHTTYIGQLERGEKMRRSKVFPDCAMPFIRANG